MTAISDELIEKFLNGHCTKEEAAFVWEYLQKNPDNRYLSEEYEQGDGVTPLQEGYKEEMLFAILTKTGRQGKGRVWTMWKWTAAASVILMMAGWWLLSRESRKGKGERRQQELVTIWIGRHNAEDHKIMLQLPDSSKAILSPGATVRYRKDFGQYARREVRMEGQARFEVIRKSGMPFVVYSEGLNTTVLGTVFEVTAAGGSNQIRVKLLEGKVMVGLDSLFRDSQSPYYLSPGEELVFNKENNHIAILDPGKHGGAYASNRVHRLSPRPDSLANWYMFNNQTLADVFDQLSAIYNVEIQYSREDLRRKYFIGKLEKKDSLNKIIRDIALLNHLTVTNENGRYIIKKRK
jgi:ferric-dicitrate binding protein FerR (iron transport regulator)